MAKRETASKASSRKSERADDTVDTVQIGKTGTADTVVKAKATGKSADKPSSDRSPSDKASEKKVATVTLTDIGDHLAATFDMPKSHAKIYLNEAVALIGKQLKKGSKVRLSGLGTLQVKKRAARKARNPNTGEEVKVKAGKRVVFAASTDLKAKL